MFDESAVSTALAQIEYRRLKPYVYRAEWSKDVEHYLYVELYGTPKQFVEVDFGFRIPGVQAFAVKCIDTYGPEIYRMMRHRQDPANSYMRFSLGRLAGWGVSDSLDSKTMPGRELAAKIREDVEQKAFPVIRNVTTPDRLLALLVVDAEPCPWHRCNGAMRAAMIALLARRLGASFEDIRSLLEPHTKQIARDLVGAPDPERYIDRIIEDAGMAAGVRND